MLQFWRMFFIIILSSLWPPAVLFGSSVITRWCPVVTVRMFPKSVYSSLPCTVHVPLWTRVIILYSTVTYTDCIQHPAGYPIVNNCKIRVHGHLNFLSFSFFIPLFNLTTLPFQIIGLRSLRFSPYFFFSFLIFFFFFYKPIEAPVRR